MARPGGGPGHAGGAHRGRAVCGRPLDLAAGARLPLPGPARRRRGGDRGSRARLPVAVTALWAVGHALCGTGDVRAAAWVAPLKEHLATQGAAPVTQGAAPVPAARAALTPPTATATEEAAPALADAPTSCPRNAARRDAPQFEFGARPFSSPAARALWRVPARVGGSAAQAGRHALERRGPSRQRPSARAAPRGALGRLRATAPRPAARTGPRPSGPAGHGPRPDGASCRPGVAPRSCGAVGGDGPRRRPAPCGTSHTHASPASAYPAALRVRNFSVAHPMCCVSGCA